MSRGHSVHNGMDIIDSRDIVARVSELEEMLETTYYDAVTQATSDDYKDRETAPADNFDTWLLARMNEGENPSQRTEGDDEKTETIQRSCNGISSRRRRSALYEERQ